MKKNPEKFVKGDKIVTCGIGCHEATFVKVQHFCGGTDIVVRIGRKHHNIAWHPGKKISHYIEHA